MEKYTRTVLNEYKESIMFKCYLQNKYFFTCDDSSSFILSLRKGNDHTPKPSRGRESKIWFAGVTICKYLRRVGRQASQVILSLKCNILDLMINSHLLKSEMCADGHSKVDSERHRYPYCIVWTPIPLLT